VVVGEDAQAGRAVKRACFLVLAACGSSPSEPAVDAAPDTFDRAAMVAHLSNDVIAPPHAPLADATAALVTAIDAGCDDAARTAWGAAIDAFERVDTVLVGPGAADNKALRDRIYAWPLVSTCGVDQQVVAYWQNPSAYDVTTKLANVRSLAAIEYLLFVDDPAHTCPLPPNGWDQLGADLPAARCGLAAAIARDVDANARALATAWETYAAQLASGDPRDAENMISDALFYVDRMVKDMKLGEAAGIVVNACGTVAEPCLREVEHRHADRASAAIAINLHALRDTFTGVDGLGFDDHLNAVGAEELATNMVAALDDAIAKADALPASYLDTLASDREQIVALHASVKVFTDDMKSQFLTVLGLDIPDDIAADND
jgi:predicted lipoprotein